MILYEPEKNYDIIEVTYISIPKFVKIILYKLKNPSPIYVLHCTNFYKSIKF